MTERGSVLLLAKKWSQNLATETTSISCTRCIKARTQSVLSAGSASGSLMSQRYSIWAEIIRGLDMIGRFILRCLMDWLWPETWLPCHVGISGDYEMSLQGRKSREGATGREPWRLWDLVFKTVHGHFCLFMCMITIYWSRSYSREGAHFAETVGSVLVFHCSGRGLPLREKVVQSNWHALTTCCCSKTVAGKDPSFISVVERPKASHLVMSVPQFPLPERRWLD